MSIFSFSGLCSVCSPWVYCVCRRPARKYRKPADTKIGRFLVRYHHLAGKFGKYPGQSLHQERLERLYLRAKWYSPMDFYRLWYFYGGSREQLHLHKQRLWV